MDIPGKKKGKRVPGDLGEGYIFLDIPGKKKGRRVPGYLGEGFKPGYTRAGNFRMVDIGINA